MLSLGPERLCAPVHGLCAPSHLRRSQPPRGIRVKPSHYSLMRVCAHMNAWNTGLKIPVSQVVATGVGETQHILRKNKTSSPSPYTHLVPGGWGQAMAPTLCKRELCLHGLHEYRTCVACLLCSVCFIFQGDCFYPILETVLSTFLEAPGTK